MEISQNEKTCPRAVDRDQGGDEGGRSQEGPGTGGAQKDPGNSHKLKVERT